MKLQKKKEETSYNKIVNLEPTLCCSSLLYRKCLLSLSTWLFYFIVRNLALHDMGTFLDLTHHWPVFFYTDSHIMTTKMWCLSFEKHRPPYRAISGLKMLSNAYLFHSYCNEIGKWGGFVLRYVWLEIWVGIACEHHLFRNYFFNTFCSQSKASVIAVLHQRDYSSLMCWWSHTNSNRDKSCDLFASCNTDHMLQSFNRHGCPTERTEVIFAAMILISLWSTGWHTLSISVTRWHTLTP